MSEDETQTEGMKALEQSLNDHMEICRLQRKAKRLKAENARLKAEVERLNYKLGRLLGAEREWVLVEPEEYQRLKAKEGNQS